MVIFLVFFQNGVISEKLRMHLSSISQKFSQKWEMIILHKINNSDSSVSNVYSTDFIWVNELVYLNDFNSKVSFGTIHFLLHLSMHDFEGNCVRKKFTRVKKTDELFLCVFND